MKKIKFIILFFIGISTFKSVAQSQEPKVAQAEQWASNNNAQLGFKENKGQMLNSNNSPADHVLFKVEQPGLNIWVTTTGLTYQFTSMTEEEHEEGGFKKDKIKGKWHRVDMILKGASIKKENLYTQGNITHGNVNYYLGHCPQGLFNIKTYTKITIKEIYSGIDWILYTSQEGGLKHDFVVHPGADPNKIQLIYEGSGSMNVNDKQIIFKNELGTVTEGSLLCYQNNTNNAIKAVYNAKQNNTPTYLGAGTNYTKIQAKELTTESPQLFSYEINIELDNYNKTEDLIIDPELVWGTLYRGTGFQGITSVDTDINDNIFAFGYTSSANFPVQDAGTFFQGSAAGGQTDLFILKFNNNGNLLWATYYGGDANDYGHSVDTDIFGNVWITGRTNSTNFPVEDAGTFFQGTNASSLASAFIVKFDNSGNLLWATYYGGTSHDEGYSITTDGSGNVFVTGETRSADFYTFELAGAFFEDNYSGGTGVFGDIFILKFSNAGNLLWSTYYGGSLGDVGSSITTDSFGNLWVVGNTNSADFPTVSLTGAYNQGTFSGGGFFADLFILKFDNLGQLLWSTYYGGSQDEPRPSIITDYSDNLWITGYTASADFPLQDAGTFFQNNMVGGTEAFILKFNNAGSPLWATFYGGNGSEGGSQSSLDKLAIDDCNNVYVTFFTTSTNMNTLNPGGCYYYDGTPGGGAAFNADVFITQFDNSGNLLWASYIGGNNNDYKSSLAIDKNNNLFITGEFSFYPNSASLPLVDYGGSAYFEDVPSTDEDAFVLKFTTSSPSPTQINVTTCTPCNGSATATSCGLPPYSYLWSTGAETLNTTDAFNTITGLCAGDYWVEVKSSCNNVDTLFYKLTGLGPSTGTDVQIACDTYTWIDGIEYTASTNTPTHTILGGASDGCDSIVTLDLTINNFVTGTDVQAACESYIWIDGIEYTASTNTPTHTIVGGAANGCDSIVTLNLTIVDEPEIVVSSNSPLCEGETLTLTANDISGADYVWSGPEGFTSMSQNPQINNISVLYSGVYEVAASVASDCGDTAEINIVVYPLPELTFLTTDDSCSTETGAIEAVVDTGNPPLNYLWSTGSIDSQISNLSSGTYSVMVTDASGCGVEQTVNLVNITEDCNDFVYVPNAFSPNGDGNNDKLYVRGEGISSLSFVVYNRWGNKVFETNDISIGWDGTYKGEAQNADVFVYMLEATFSNGQVVKEGGDITLLR